ncbi:MAG: glycosyltransferase family 9 protein [Bacteroidota bacterium]
MNTNQIFSPSSKILIIKPRAIGDVLLSTPVIRNLKEFVPEASIDFLTEQFAADVVIGNRFVREVLTFHKKHDSTLAVIRKIREKRYDIVIDLFGNPRTALITRFSGAPHRIGFPFRGRAYAYNHHLTAKGGEVHNVDFNLEALRHFGIPIVSSDPEFPISNVHREFANTWLAEKQISGRSFIGINPGGGWYTKKWSLESYAQLADRISGNNELTIMLFWGPGEKEEVKKVQAMMKSESVLLPKTSLKEMGAFLERCSYLISNDSGPMHIAASLGVPTLGIFGPTNPHLQGPYGGRSIWVRNETLDCLECNLTDCPIGNVCMRGLTIDMVFEAFQKLQKKNSQRS